MRIFFCGAALVALAACQPAIPDSAAGVFDRVDAERQARDAQLEAPLSITPPVTTTPLDTSQNGTLPLGTVPPGPGELDAERAEIARQQAANSGVVPLQADPSNPPPGGNAGISNEQDFDVVSGRRSIEADAARVQANAQQYQVVQPTALPTRSGNSGPNVVEYALRTSHPKGQQIYRRSGFRAQTKFERNCAVYRSADAAQLDFLADGGPQRDKKGLDPDGDGYACNWDPAPFRAVRGAAVQPQPPVVPAGAISTENR